MTITIGIEKSRSYIFVFFIIIQSRLLHAFEFPIRGLNKYFTCVIFCASNKNIFQPISINIALGAFWAFCRKH